MINQIHIINGPNLNLLGIRNPEIYGSIPFETYFIELKKKFADITLAYFQSNHEGEIIDYLHKNGFETKTGIILNAGGLSHTSISIRDAVESVVAPVIEVHISDIYSREPFRLHSFLTDVCIANFIGKGLQGYDMGIAYLLNVPLNPLKGTF
jgi:3-dehydroquinate dehydratase-2